MAALARRPSERRVIMEPDMRAATVGRYMTVTEAIMTTADAGVAVIPGRFGCGVN